MQCLNAVYDWRAGNASTDVGPGCSCMDLSPVEQEVQDLKAEGEFRHIRDRVRKSSTKMVEEANAKKAGICIDWQIEPSQLVRYLCYWKHTSALTKIGMTSALAELLRHHRRLEGAPVEPPPSKNTLILTVWNLATMVQTKLRKWAECKLASDEKSFDRVIVVRVSNLVPIWAWEADALRNRPALADVCNRLLSMELWQYRKRCQQMTSAEKKLMRDHEPYLTPMGLRWRVRQVDVSAGPSQASIRILKSRTGFNTSNGSRNIRSGNKSNNETKGSRNSSRGGSSNNSSSSNIADGSESSSDSNATDSSEDEDQEEEEEEEEQDNNTDGESDERSEEHDDDDAEEEEEEESKHNKDGSHSASASSDLSAARRLKSAPPAVQRVKSGMVKSTVASVQPAGKQRKKHR